MCKTVVYLPCLDVKSVLLTTGKIWHDELCKFKKKSTICLAPVGARHVSWCTDGVVVSLPWWSLRIGVILVIKVNVLIPQSLQKATLLEFLKICYLFYSFSDKHPPLIAPLPPDAPKCSSYSSKKLSEKKERKRSAWNECIYNYKTVFLIHRRERGIWCDWTDHVPTGVPGVWSDTSILLPSSDATTSCRHQASWFRKHGIKGHCNCTGGEFSMISHIST